MDFVAGDIAVTRMKGSVSNRQPLVGEDLRDLRRLRRSHKHDVCVFTGERGRVTRSGFAKILKAAEARVGMERVNPHSLRHAAAHALALNGRQVYDIQQVLGHKSLASSGKYIHGISSRLRGLWDGI